MNRYTRNENRSSQGRTNRYLAYQKQQRIARNRNIFFCAILAAFVVAVAIFAIFRWAVNTEEGPISLPSASPTPAVQQSQEPSSAPESQSPSSAPSPSPSPDPIEPYQNETGYQSEAMTFEIEKVTEENLVYYVVDMVVRDMSAFKSAFSGKGDAISRNTYENPVDIAERNNAILAINCDNAGYNADGIIVRNGTLYRFDPCGRELMMIYADGTMRCCEESEFSSQEQIADEISKGLLHTFSFGPILIHDGKPTGDYSEYTEIGGANPRTAVGMVEPGHFKIVIVDGRVEESGGVRLPALEEIMVDLGCTEAFNLDGGSSSILIYDGKVLNAIAGRESPRPVTDILYFGENA